MSNILIGRRVRVTDAFSTPFVNTPADGVVTAFNKTTVEIKFDCYQFPVSGVPRAAVDSCRFETIRQPLYDVRTEKTA